MYALSPVVNRIGKLALELVASPRIKGRHLICTYREQVSLKWAERGRMNLFIVTTLAIVRYRLLSIRNGNEEALVMNWIKVIATANSTVLSSQTITMTWQIKYSTNSKTRMWEMRRRIAGIVHSNSRSQSLMILTVVWSSTTLTQKSQ